MGFPLFSIHNASQFPSCGSSMLQRPGGRTLASESNEVTLPHHLDYQFRFLKNKTIVFRFCLERKRISKFLKPP